MIELKWLNSNNSCYKIIPKSIFNLPGWSCNIDYSHNQYTSISSMHATLESNEYRELRSLPDNRTHISISSAWITHSLAYAAYLAPRCIYSPHPRGPSKSVVFYPPYRYPVSRIALGARFCTLVFAISAQSWEYHIYLHNSEEVSRHRLCLA